MSYRLNTSGTGDVSLISASLRTKAELKGLTAGTGVTLTNAANAITIGVNKPAQFATGTTTTTFAANQLTGAAVTVYTNTQGTPGSIATRTATQMFAEHTNAKVGDAYILRIINGQGTGTLTVTAGSGVTLTGTATIAINTWRDFVVTFTSATALVIQNAGTGTFS